MWVAVILDANGATRDQIFLKGPICKIGRRDENCISFPSDASISRNHGEIHIDCDKAFIKDLGSKFGTTITCTESTTSLDVGCELLEIKSGQQASFGRLSATVRFMKVCITICVTRLDKKGKREVELAASHIGGLILQLPDNATHIVTNSICGATAKIMSGIVFEKSIVTTEWLVFASTLKPSSRIPSVTSYFPPTEKTDLILTDHLVSRRGLLNGLFIISTNPADAQYSNLVVGCGAEFLIVENPTADEFNAILRRVPRLVPTIVCLFVDEFSNLDTRSSAMEHYQAGMFYLSAAQLASAIFSNIVPVLTGGPPRQRSNLSQRFNTQCTQSQTIVSRKPPTVTQETSGSNRPNSSASNFHTLSMDPPTYPLRGSESIGTICGERLPDKITKSQEDDVDLSSPTTPPAVSCTNDHHQHLMKNKVSGAAENVEKSAYTKKLSDDVHSPSMKKLKKRNCSAYEEPLATPIQSKDASLHSTNRSNVIEKNIHASFETEDSKSMRSPGNDETSVNKEKSVDRKKENFVNKILIQGEDHTVNENVSDEKSKSRDYVDNSNDSDGMFFEERISLKRKQDTLVEDNSDDWVHAAKDADRHELLKCKRTKYKLEYGNISADDISASQAVEVKLEAVVIMKMMIIKRNVDPSGQYKDSGRRLSRDVRRFRKNSIRVVNTESVMSARFMDAVLPKESEREIQLRRDANDDQEREEAAEQMFSDRFGAAAKGKIGATRRK